MIDIVDLKRYIKCLVSWIKIILYYFNILDYLILKFDFIG